MQTKLSPIGTVLKELSLFEMEYVYNQHMKHDFPLSEINPLTMIKKLHKKGEYIGFGLFEDDSLRSYGLFVPSPSKVILLDYLAVLPQYRQSGFGSVFLSDLRNFNHIYDGVIIEVEDPEYSITNEEHQMQMKRIAFYEKNGFIMTTIKSIQFNVNYLVMYLPLNGLPLEEFIYEELCEIYQIMFPSGKLAKKAIINKPCHIHC